MHSTRMRGDQSQMGFRKEKKTATEGSKLIKAQHLGLQEEKTFHISTIDGRRWRDLALSKTR